MSNLLSCLGEVRGEFYRQGFGLPLIYLEAVESIRVRRSGERSFQYFLDEVVKESLGLAYPWQPSVRHLVNSDNRSDYIDWLLAHSAYDNNHLSVDPNYNLFVQADGQWFESSLAEFRDRKQCEADQMVAHYYDVPMSATVVKSISNLAERLGYAAKKKTLGRGRGLEMEGVSSETIGSAIKILDLHSLENRGDVVVQYFFSDLPNRPLGLDLFVPGGYLYSQWNKSEKMILFSFYSQIRFLIEMNRKMLLR